MKTRLAFKQLLPILVVFLVYGCTTPVPKSEITPKLYSGTEKNVAVGVIEARPYVLSGNKGPRFEGIFRDQFGIPVPPLFSPERPGKEPFVDLLSGMIKDGLSDAGAKVSVVSLPAGSSVDDPWKKMADTGASRYILMRVNESNWDDGGRSPTYKYNFGLVVAGKGGTVLGSTNLAGEQANRRAGRRDPFDTYSLSYRSLIEKMFSDPAIKQALGN
jgi:hypothetical protein